jgi:hypothetical protein
MDLNSLIVSPMHHGMLWVNRCYQVSRAPDGRKRERDKKMSQYRLAERAVLMRMSAGMPGKSRTKKTFSENVKNEHALGKQSGAWVANRWPKDALEPMEKVVNEARAYHAAVTLPFDAGIGILPAALVLEYAERMKAFASRFMALRDTHFREKYPGFVEWAKAEHNGTFEPGDYPDVADILGDFYFRTEPLPVPDAGHFESTVAGLLGMDAESINIRVNDAMHEGMKELMRRMIEPLRAMVDKLTEQPKIKASGKVAEDIVFRDTLIGNIRQIAELAPKLNISGDPAIDQFAVQMAKLASVEPEKLREDKSERAVKAAAAAELLKRLEGYKL